MIYLSPRVKSGYNEETFWVWFERNFPNSTFNLPAPNKYKPDDVVLRYSTMGPLNSNIPKTIAICWELLPEMKIVLKEKTWDGLIQRTYHTAQSCDHITVASRFSVPFYEKYGKVDILPIGVNTDLFKPYSEEEKYKLRDKYNIPHDKEIGFWCGTTHKMKGLDLLQKYANENPEIFWVIVWYPGKGKFIGNGNQYTLVDQPTMAELMNTADFQLGTSRLRPYYIIEYEAMACNLKQRSITGLEKDFETGDNPREALFEHGWDRHTAKKVWENYINNA